MKSRIRCLGVVILLLASITSGVAQNEEVRRTVGLTASLQSGQVEILVPLWLGDTMVLAPGLGFIYVENVGMDVRLVLAPRFYLSMHRVAPYFGARVAVLLNLPDTGSNTTDFLIGVVFGGEYFVNPKFSFGVEAQVNGTISDNASTRFASPGAITISTGAAAHVNVYF